MFIEMIAKAVEVGTEALSAEKPMFAEKTSCEGKEIAEQAEFKDYSNLMSEVQRHLEKARSYEREANKLERDIQRNKEPASKMSEVRRLRISAEREKREAKKCQDMARRILTIREESMPDAETRTENVRELSESDKPVLSLEEKINQRSKSEISFGLGPCSRTCAIAKVNKGSCFHS